VRRRGRTALWAATAAALVALLPGCGITHMQDLNFRVDNRLHFTSPPSRSTVHPPFTVSWRMDDFTVEAPGSAPPSDNAGYFAVFVDQAPIRPGHTLKDVGSGDPSCENDPKCPDQHYLAANLVFTTTQDSLRLPLIPPLSGDPSSLQLHSVTVVLLDTRGHRIGESAWELDVRIPRLYS
jgi:hypothetical protein